MGEVTSQHDGSQYRMPAEWARHSRTWMGWPERTDNWRENAEPAQHAFVEVATAISRFEPVTICANPNQVDKARRMLPESVTVESLEQDDSWFRDSGPTFVSGSQGPVAIDWEFNGWGGDVLPSCEQDKKIASYIASQCGTKSVKPGIVLEGGSIHVDGEGTLLTTEECLLHRNRNPSLSKEQIEQVLCENLGVSKIIWLPLGLVADEDTNGHVDNFACFCAPAHVLLSWPSADDPDQLSRSQLALDILQKTTDAKGRQVKVTKLYLPPPLHYTEEEVKTLDLGNGDQQADLNSQEGAERLAGQRLAASYVNFYVCNKAVICPAFGGEAEKTDSRVFCRAVETLKEAFPDREIVPIKRARDILLGGGNVHCITQQQPEF